MKAIETFRSSYAYRRKGIVAVMVAALLPAVAGADMPNRAITPGDVAERNTSLVCRIGEARRERNVPYRVRDRVYLAYGIPRGQRKGLYRIDHLIPLELGGSNRPANLWPQTYQDSKVKDRVEGELHDAVCSGAMTLDAAQRAIAKDWHSAVPASFAGR
jgi:hypothetical protein